MVQTLQEYHGKVMSRRHGGRGEVGVGAGHGGTLAQSVWNPALPVFGDVSHVSPLLRMGWQFGGSMVKLIRSLCFCMFWSLVLPLAYAAAGEANNAGAPLRVGVDVSYPPFAYEQPRAGKKGFDRDFVDALCHAMKRQCIQLPMELREQQEGLRRGDLDFVVAGYAQTEERARFMAFSAPYYRSRSIYIGRPGIVVSREGLRGKRLAVLKWTVQESFLRSRWGDVCEVLAADTFDQVLGLLCTGKADALLTVGLLGYDFLKTDAGQPFMPLAVPDPADQLVTTEHVAVRKGAGTLLDDINNGLNMLRESGEFSRIMRRYFSTNIY